MDEITQVKELRADAPTPDRARLAPGRQRLADTAAQASRSRTRRIRTDWRFAAVGAAAAVTVAALIGTQLVGGGDDKAGPAGSIEQQKNQVGSATELLQRAATAAEGRPDPKPKVGQWVYEKSLRGNETDQREPVANEEWHQYADPEFENWKEGDDHSFRERYEFMAELPDDPEKLLKEIRGYYPSGDGPKEPKNLHNYRAARVLLQTYPTPSEGLARVLRALITVDGMKLADHTVEDAQGEPALALYNTARDNGTRSELLFDPKTYKVIGSRWVVTEDDPFEDLPGDGASSHKKAGDVLINSVVVKQGLVDRKGQQP